jgi:hypothetical protein
MWVQFCLRAAVVGAILHHEHTFLLLPPGEALCALLGILVAAKITSTLVSSANHPPSSIPRTLHRVAKDVLWFLGPFLGDRIFTPQTRLFLACCGIAQVCLLDWTVVFFGAAGTLAVAVCREEAQAGSTQEKVRDVAVSAFFAIITWGARYTAEKIYTKASAFLGKHGLV